jgi:hypothetical protein
MTAVVRAAVTAVWSLFCLPLRLVEWLFQSGDQAYSSLDHVALNVVKPQTEWMNMGNWQVSAKGSFATQPELTWRLYRIQTTSLRLAGIWQSCCTRKQA